MALKTSASVIAIFLNTRKINIIVSTENTKAILFRMAFF
jgi:hypothetical protein